MVTEADEYVDERPAGRTVPHNLDAEASLLGAMLMSRDAITAAVETVKVEDFYKPNHADIFEAILRVWNAGEAVDPLTVGEDLERGDLLDKIGGLGVLVDLESRTPATSNAAHYAKIVEERATMRKLIEVGSEVAQLGYDVPDDVAATVDEAERLVFEVASRRVVDSTLPSQDVIASGLVRLETLYEHGDLVTGLPTGYRDLDLMLSGLQPHTMTVVGARPSMGKTAFALGASSYAALVMNRPVLFFSLEMGHQELAQRMLASEGNINSSRLKNGQMRDGDWFRLSGAVDRISNAPLFIDDNPQLSVTEIRAKARRIKSKVGDLGLVVIDYLQLMSGGSGDNRQIEISAISRGLKVLARELECPVVALSQLSRGLEQRSDKRPMLSDLRESGALEQDADVVLFLYRDEIYNSDSEDKGSVEIIVAKQRNGPTGTVRLGFQGEFTRFVNIAE